MWRFFFGPSILEQKIDCIHDHMKVIEEQNNLIIEMLGNKDNEELKFLSEKLRRSNVALAHSLATVRMKS